MVVMEVPVLMKTYAVCSDNSFGYGEKSEERNKIWFQ